MSKNIWKPLGVLGVCVLFGAVAGLGYRFISQAEDSAAHINSQVASNRVPLDVNSANLSPHAASGINARFYTPESRSSGRDLSIRAGEFAYVNGQAVVRVRVYNQGSFPITATQVSLAMMVDDNPTPLGEAVVMPFVFPVPLMAGAETEIEFPLQGDVWTQEAVKSAQKHRVLAQIVSVSDGDNDNIDYPQTSPSVLLKPTGQTPALAHETPPASAPMPSEAEAPKEEILTPPPPIATENPFASAPAPTAHADWLKADLPEHNETGVLSYEFTEHKK